MFRALCAHHQEVKTVLYSLWYHHTCRWLNRAQVERRLQRVHGTSTYTGFGSRNLGGNSGKNYPFIKE